MSGSCARAGLYVHIPFCQSKCDYCDFFSVPCKNGVGNDFLTALESEILFYSKKLDIQMWSTVYIGGGTPSLLSPEQIELLMDIIKKSVNCSPSEEVTMEMNPQSIDQKKIAAAGSSGVTRLSLGVQSLTESALNSVNRRCSPDIAARALDLVKKNWTGRLNLDCMAGLPEQSDSEFLASLKNIVSYSPDHISLYTLTIEDGTPLAKRIADGFPFDYEKADEQWLAGRNFLESQGFRQYEVSNFSKPGFESKHNMSYWNQKNYIGVGPGATSSVYSFSENTCGVRWTNTKDIKKYIEFWNGLSFSEQDIPRDTEILDQDTQEFEFLMMGLRTLNGITQDEYKKRFSHLQWKGNLNDRLGANNGPWEKFDKENLCNKNLPKGKFALNRNGILFLNRLLEEYI